MAWLEDLERVAEERGEQGLVMALQKIRAFGEAAAQARFAIALAAKDAARRIRERTSP